MSARENPIRGRSAASDDLSNRVNRSGLIQGGAHPEFDQPTPLEKIGSWIDQHFGTKHKPKPTPSTGPVGG